MMENHGPFETGEILSSSEPGIGQKGIDIHSWGFYDHVG
jgi:hypothetical protein